MLCFSDCRQSCRNANALRFAALRAFSRLRAAASLARSSRDCAFSLFCEGPQHEPMVFQKQYPFFLCGGLPPASCNRCYVSPACARRPRARSKGDSEPARWPNSTAAMQTTRPRTTTSRPVHVASLRESSCGRSIARDRCMRIFRASLESLGLAPPALPSKKAAASRQLLLALFKPCIYLND